MLLRDGPAGLETFMVVRHHQIEFASGALVFPGGRMEAADAELAVAARAERGGAVSDRVLQETDPLAPFKVAAIREAFEECGVLIARARGEDGLVPAGRAASLDRAAPFGELLAREALVPALDLLVPFAHWITPVFLPKRFDTRFFLALAPPGQALAHDGREAVELDLDFAARGAAGARQAVQAPLSDRAEPMEARGPDRQETKRAPAENRRSERQSRPRRPRC